jgi:hypothetical protein
MLIVRDTTMLNELDSFEAQVAIRAFRHSRGAVRAHDEEERERVLAEASSRHGERARRLARRLASRHAA